MDKLLEQAATSYINTHNSPTHNPLQTLYTLQRTMVGKAAAAVTAVMVGGRKVVIWVDASFAVSPPTVTTHRISLALTCLLSPAVSHSICVLPTQRTRRQRSSWL